MPATDFEVNQSDATEGVASTFSSSSPPGEPAASCPLLALAAGKGTALEGAAAGGGKPEAKSTVATDHESEIGLKTNVGADYTWFNTEGAAKQWGDDKNNFQLGSYSASLSSGISKVDGGVKADLISGSAEVAGAKASGEKQFLGGVADIKGNAEILSAIANANVGAELSNTKKAIEASVGAEASLAKAQAGGEINYTDPLHQPSPDNRRQRRRSGRCVRDSVGRRRLESGKRLLP